MRPERRSALQILLSPSAERPFQVLAPAIKEQLTRIIEGIAALAAVTPPLDPVWLRIPQLGAPLMRFQHAGIEVFYEIDTRAGTLRITSVRHAETVELSEAV